MDLLRQTEQFDEAQAELDTFADFLPGGSLLIKIANLENELIRNRDHATHSVSGQKHE